MSRSLELLSSDTRSSSGLLTDIDYMVVLRTFERQIESWYQHVINADSEHVLNFPITHSDASVHRGRRQRCKVSLGYARLLRQLLVIGDKFVRPAERAGTRACRDSPFLCARAIGREEVRIPRARYPRPGRFPEICPRLALRVHIVRSSKFTQGWLYCLCAKRSDADCHIATSSGVSSHPQRRERDPGTGKGRRRCIRQYRRRGDAHACVVQRSAPCSSTCEDRPTRSRSCGRAEQRPYERRDSPASRAV